MSDLLSDRPVRGINVAVLSDGREIHIHDIATPAEGQAILDDIDEAIIKIEAQLEFGDNDRIPNWRTKATVALKYRRRLRPALQHRIGELRRAEKAEAIRDTHAKVSSKVDAKRQAFVHAAYELLGHETCTEVWARAQEKQPNLFADERGAP